jgi:hypothetical protein
VEHALLLLLAWLLLPRRFCCRRFNAIAAASSGEARPAVCSLVVTWVHDFFEPL